MTSPSKNQQLICTVAFLTVITNLLGLVQPGLAATGSSQQSENAAASTQPLWSYQAKPTNYVNAAQSAPYATGPSSIFEAFSGLSQRQGALTGSSPFLSILPIILIAAGGLLLLLPMLTMMMASPFGGGGAFGAGGYQNYGYPQVGLNKRRSLDQMSAGSGRGVIELIEHVSSTIEDLSRRYSAGSAQQQQQPGGGSQSANKRSKALNGVSPAVAANNHQASAAATNSNESPPLHPANHKPSDSEVANAANSVSNLINLGQ